MFLCVSRSLRSSSRGCVLAAVRGARRRPSTPTCSSITGVPGDEEHAQQFQKWATTFVDAAKKKDARPRREHHLSRRATPRRRATASTKSVHRPRRRARQAERRASSSCSSATAASTAADGGVQPAGPGSDGRRLGDAARQASAQRVGFVNTASSSGAFLPGAGRARAASSSPRPRPAASATRRASPNSSSKRSPTTPPIAIATATCRCSKRSSTRRPRSARPTSRRAYILTEHATIDDGGGGTAGRVDAVSRHRTRRRSARRRHERSGDARAASTSATPSRSRSPA